MTLHTVQKDVRTQFILEKSLFICTLKKVADEETALSAINALKKQYWDATHNPFAYIIGETQNCQKANDDGEPSGTAGHPILEVLKKRNLHDVLAVSTRYFGGIKLGVGGLARAYARSVAEAIEASGISQKQLLYSSSFSESLQNVGKTLHSLYGCELFSIIAVDYGEDVSITIKFRAEDLTATENMLRELLSRSVKLSLINKEYIEIPLLTAD